MFIVLCFLLKELLPLVIQSEAKNAKELLEAVDQICCGIFFLNNQIDA